MNRATYGIVWILVFLTLCSFALTVAKAEETPTELSLKELDNDQGVMLTLPCNDDQTVHTVQKQVHSGEWYVMLQRFKFVHPLKTIGKLDCSEGYSHFEIVVEKQPNEALTQFIVESCIDNNCVPKLFDPIAYVEMPERPETNCKTDTFNWIEQDSSNSEKRVTKNVGAYDWMFAEVVSVKNNPRIRLRVVSPTITDMDDLMIAYNTDFNIKQIQEWDKYRVERVKPTQSVRNDERWLMVNKKWSKRILEEELPFRFVFGYSINNYFMPLSGVGICPRLETPQGLIKESNKLIIEMGQPKKEKIGLVPLRGKEKEEHDNLASKVYRIGNGVSSPRVLSRVNPEITDEFRNANRCNEEEAGATVLLAVEVWEDGLPHNMRILRSAGMQYEGNDYGLDERAKETIKKWRFYPGELNNKPVRTVAQIQITYRILAGKQIPISRYCLEQEKKNKKR